MIIPTADFDPMFADDGIPFQSKMTQYIQREFSDILGPNVAMLKSPDGLDVLYRLYSGTTSEESRAA
jgi:hypothetical protein